ncbi:MAG: ABC transporter ATP-binding protein [Bacillota bacterium]|jgi:ABC-2 type transport system ATP-binding protein
MIVAENISKNFNDIKAIDSISAEIKKGSIFGLIGTNGAGKSTFLRMLSGIYRPDSGKITIDGAEVFENIDVKKRVFYISDDQYFLAASTPKMMANFYASVYETFDMARFDSLLKSFDLDPSRKINTFSKGMKKQVSIICGLAAGTDYIFCDETFDGLDPVMRQAVKSLLAADVADKQLTPIIASHNLRELEDICDHVGLLHKGGILLNKDLDDMKTNIHKVQCVLPENTDLQELGLSVLQSEKRGSLSIIIARGEAEDIMRRIHASNPIFAEILPLTLEEIFISETEVAGYDIKKILI